MCGLVGFLTPGGGNADTLTAQARICGDAIRHRGPDDADTWVDAAAGLALAHRRLSIIDLSALGHQPMVSSCGRWVIAFNGEIYNFRPLRAALEAEGERFAGHSDTEVLLHGILRWGVEEALRRANGMFAFALWDRQERLLTLARDRFGQKPLYYGRCGQTVLFGSELKALQAHPDFSAEIDRRALTLFLRYGYVPAPLSIYQGIQKLLPGTILRISASGEMREPVPYWSAVEAACAGQASPFEGTPEDAVDALDAVLGSVPINRIPLEARL